MINWNDLRYFVALARTGTLAGAAKALKVDQTTVGRRLAALEADLGAHLITRTPEGYTLTSAGERSLAIAGDIDERIGMLEAVVHGSDDRLDGVVRVATNEAFSVGFLLERLVKVRDCHPAIRLEVVTSNGPVNLLRREADVAIRIAPRALPDQQGLVVRRLATLALSLYATRAYLDAHRPVDVDEGLRDHEVVFFEQEIADAPPGRWLATSASSAVPVVRVNSFLGAATAAAAGAGLALVPCYLAATYPSLVPAIAKPVVTSDAWLLVHPELHATARVRVVVEHLIAELASAQELLAPS